MGDCPGACFEAISGDPRHRRGGLSQRFTNAYNVCVGRDITSWLCTARSLLLLPS